MALTKTDLHVDNIHLLKQLDENYKQAFNRLYDYLLADTRRNDFDKSIVLNIALQQCLEGMKDQKKAQLVIPRDLKEYVSKYTKGPVYKEMKKELRNQDYEKIVIGGIWMVTAMAIALFVLKNIIMQEYLVNYWVDSLVGVVAGVIAYRNFQIKRRIINRYQFGSLYIRIDLVTIASCVFIKLISPSNFDITYLLLVLSFIITKRKIKPQFEEVI